MDRESGLSQPSKVLLRSRSPRIETLDSTSQSNLGPGREPEAALREKASQRSVTECGRLCSTQRFGVEAELVDLEPQRIARNQRIDRERDLDEKMIEAASSHGSSGVREREL
jgi:hypothetical protein